MVEKRGVERISVYLNIKEIDRSPIAVSNLLNISAFGAQIETTTIYRSGDLIKFNCISPAPSLRDLGIPHIEDTIWNIPASLLREELVSGRVIWVMPHPDKANYFIVGLKFFTKLNRLERIFSFILLLIVATIGVEIVTIGPSGLYGHILGIFKWCLSLYEAMQTALSRLIPF